MVGEGVGDGVIVGDGVTVTVGVGVAKILDMGAAAWQAMLAVINAIKIVKKANLAFMDILQFKM
jgi:hypothetical protein